MRVSTWGPQRVEVLTCLKKIRICAVISLAFYLQWDVIKAPSVQSRFVYNLLTFQPIFGNFDMERVLAAYLMLLINILLSCFALDFASSSTAKLTLLLTECADT